LKAGKFIQLEGLVNLLEESCTGEISELLGSSSNSSADRRFVGVNGTLRSGS